MERSLESRETFLLSFRDAAVVEAPRAGGCRELSSEDLQHGRDFREVRVVNPFF